MTHDLTVEELCSRYLDDDLEPDERRRFERLLAADETARDRLRRLEAVVRGLDALPREPSPISLRSAVRRSVASRSAAGRWLDRVQRGLQGLVLDSPLVASFAVVLCLGASLYLLADGTARRSARPTSLVVPPGSTVTAPAGSTTRVVGERRFEDRAGTWWEEGVETPPGRRLRGADLEAWLTLHPGDRELAALAADVVVQTEGEVLVLAFAATERAR
jgi:anti-sigma factor RsiW